MSKNGKHKNALEEIMRITKGVQPALGKVLRIQEIAHESLREEPPPALGIHIRDGVGADDKVGG